MNYIFLDNGFEEIEAITTIDLLRRANIALTTVSVTGQEWVMGAHNIPVKADALIANVDFADAEMSTPRGMYEALVYRRVAHFWYMACDEHRGDVIPGTITISLRINKRGQIDSMALIRRSGASISQQSFTFKAIRKASLPPMPQEVQADVIGELMELIFEFNFD